MLQPVELQFIGLVLRLLFKPARPRGQLVLLLAGLGAHVEGQFRHGGHVVDDPSQAVQLLAYHEELLGVGGQVVAVALARLSTGIIEIVKI